MDNAPAAEVLKPRTAGGAEAAPAQPATPEDVNRLRRRSYRPSHKATFIGLGVVIAILAINAVIFTLVLKKQAKNDSLAAKGQVSLSSADLEKLGINRGAVGGSGVQLTVAPDAQFKGKVSVDGNTTFSGPVSLNNKLNATDANLTQLQAGKTSLSDLNVNGDGTLSTLNLRKDLKVAGITQLQGAVTINQLLSVNNSANVLGNLAVGGTLSAKSFSIQTLTVNGHLLTSGPTPSVGPGGTALGSNGTVGISGNDAAGTISINIGVGATSGTLVNVAFRSQYGNTPRVVVTPVGIGASFYLSSVTSSGFSVAVASGLPAGGYRLNYIAMQ